MKKILFKSLYLIFLISPVYNILGVTWAILPSKFERFQHSPSTGPQINPNNPNSGWDMAKLYRIYLNANYINTILPMDNVEKAYKNNNLSLNADLNEYDLQKISRDIDADKLLLTRIQENRNGYTVLLQIYFIQSSLLSEPLSFSGDDLYFVIGEALKSQFQIREEVFSKNSERLDLIFSIDASGKNYNEIKSTASIIKDFDIHTFSGVSVDGYGKTLFLKETGDKSAMLEYISKIKAQSTDTTENLYPTLLEETIKLTKPGKKHIIFLFVSGSPRTMESRQKTNGFIRKLGRHYHLLIFGNGKMSHEDRNYWSSLSSINQNIYYNDIIYSVKTGLSDGSEIYLMKSGEKLYESNINQIENSHEIELGTDLAGKFLPEKIISIFEESTYQKTVSHGNIEIRFNLNPMAEIMSYKVEDSTEKKIKVLLLISGKPFWIKIPYKQVSDSQGNLLISENNSYFFLLNLKEGGSGLPLQNTTNFGTIIQANQVSNIIKLDLTDYFKKPQKYLNKSIGGTSLYILYGKVVEYQMERKILY